MEIYSVQSGFVKIEKIGIPHKEFESPRLSGKELQLEISRRRGRARSIQEQNRRTQGKM